MIKFPTSIDEIPGPETICKHMVLTEEQVNQFAQIQGELIANELRENDVHLLNAICVMNGAMAWYTKLLRAIRNAVSNFEKPYHLSIIEDSIKIGSYGNGTTRSRETTTYKDLQFGISGIHVLLVEDIADSGESLRHLLQSLALKGPRGYIRVAVMIQRYSCCKIAERGVFVGFPYDGDEFLAGTGLDWCQLYREVGGVFAIKEEYKTKKYMKRIEKLLRLN